MGIKLYQLVSSRRPVVKMRKTADLDTDFHRMDPAMLQKSLSVLVKRGKAQVFGSEDQQGVKFF